MAQCRPEWCTASIRPRAAASMAGSSIYANLGQVHGRFGILHVQVAQTLHDGPGHDEITVPLVVRRYDVPGGVLGAALGEHVLVGFLIRRPESALLDVVE